MKTKKMYVLCIVLVIVVTASVFLYLDYQANEKTTFDGTLVQEISQDKVSM